MFVCGSCVAHLALRVALLLASREDADHSNHTQQPHHACEAGSLGKGGGEGCADVDRVEALVGDDGESAEPEDHGDVGRELHPPEEREAVAEEEGRRRGSGQQGVAEKGSEGVRGTRGRGEGRSEGSGRREREVAAKGEASTERKEERDEGMGVG